MAKKKVYIETTVVSDATALPTNDLALVGRQVATREWWEKAQKQFELFVSPVVRREVANGDVDAACRRLAAIADIPDAALTLDAANLANRLIEEKAVPSPFRDDAMHIAIAAVSGMDYLVSWNFKHITNARMIPKIKKVCLECGYRCAEICTPQMLRIEDEEEYHA